MDRNRIRFVRSNDEKSGGQDLKLASNENSWSDSCCQLAAEFSFLAKDLRWVDGILTLETTIMLPRDVQLQSCDFFPFEANKVRITRSHSFTGL